MSKAILVMDMPKCCDECDLYYENNNSEDICIKGNRYIETCVWRDKPDWCPLKKFPEKKEPNSLSDSEYFEAIGYNAAIDEILGKGGE